tara:strand:- start:244 stop:807 length:564 start_codon:yes stop_codon:yes gene_type:complete
MYISHKSNVLQVVHETEWQCRRITKGLTKPEYWEWLATITSGDPPTIDYSGETGYTIVECTDENVQERLVQLDDYVSRKLEGATYNIKYYASIRDAEEILDNDGKSHDPKQYVQSHFVPDDSAKDARLLADKWANVRSERNRKLAETDYLALSDNTLADNMKTYRSKLRSVPQDNDDPDDIIWPAKP